MPWPGIAIAYESLSGSIARPVSRLRSAANGRRDALRREFARVALRGAARQRREYDTNGAPPAVPVTVEFRYTQTDAFPALLAQLGASLLVSTYQANKLLAVRTSGNGLSTLVRTFDRPMGLAVDGSWLALGTRKEIWLLSNAPDLAPRIEPVGHHDACFLPRWSHVTGDIGVHELAWVGGELWIVGTRFSCLATLSPDYSFVPRWRPPFVSTIAA